jgi:hypothetical protein
VYAFWDSDGAHPICHKLIAGLPRPSKTWQQHTAQLMSRVIAVSATTFEFLHDHLDTLPQPPLAVQLSDRAALKYQLALVVIGALRTAREIAFSWIVFLLVRRVQRPLGILEICVRHW